MTKALHIVIMLMSWLALSGEAFSASIPHGDHHADHVQAHEAGLHITENGEHKSPHASHGCGVCHHIMISFSLYRPTLMALSATGYLLDHERARLRNVRPPLQPPMV